MSKIDNNKEQKRNSLLDSAFTLFLDNGFNKTSISDIVEKAGVAKGTFYLYFKDKYDIRNQLISHKANQVFQAACNELLKHKELKDFEEQLLFIIDNILDQFAQNHHLVMLLSKHLSWGFFTDFLAVAPSDDRPSIYAIYQTMLDHASHTYRTPDVMMYMIIELVSGTSYNTILYKQPLSLEQIKKPLYEVIKGIFVQFRE